MTAIMQRLRVWDAPVRLFHWALVLLIGAAWWTEEQRMLDWHRLTGYAILTLLLFRILWGLIGSGTARFARFVRGPRAVAAYVRHHMFDRQAEETPGHNPLGGWSVVLMLTLLLSQVMLGLFAIDIDGLESGPFSYLVDFDMGRLASQWHGRVFNMLLALIALHIGAILFHLCYRRENLVGAMLSGSRKWRGTPPRLPVASGHRALVALTGAAALVWLLVGLWGRT